VVQRKRTPIIVAGVCALLAVAAVAVVALAAARPEKKPERPVATVRPDSFDVNRAWAELRRQVEIGPRPAGTPELRGLARRLRDQLPNGRFESVPGHPGLRNVTGRLPGDSPAVLVAAHYDTKDLPGFVGANDGAAGTAAVLELARVLRTLPREREIRFALFDGEEATDDRRPFLATGLRGSRAYARRHGEQIGAMVLLDFIAADPLKIRREANSDPRLWKVLRAAARRAGAADAFPGGTIGAITDDHTPFLLQGVPAIDLIAWPYPCWHRSCDNLESVDRRSLGKSGAAVLELVRTLAG
jgi:glutaminyl-peptide cyclotransferase